uniref:Uncharacterized protein n=1 Tax=Enterovibrio norvegicus TaxID=188144 RepID=A0A0H4A3W1_9GAMM|nr:hypothetical protein [Enterovibrio norvegicus]
MSWKVEEIKEHLEKMQFSMGDIDCKKDKFILKSNYLSLSQDMFEVNAVASYVYCSHGNNAELIQLSASKGNKNYLLETELNFAKMVVKALSFFDVCSSEVPERFELPTETFTIGDYTLRVDSEESYCNAFIAFSSNFDHGMNLRNALLYPDLYDVEK